MADKKKKVPTPEEIAKKIDKDKVNSRLAQSELMGVKPIKKKK